MKFNPLISQAVDMILASDHTIAFTGAGISAESGVPTFRDANGLWNQYDPQILQLDFFRNNPQKCWPMIKDTFYQYYHKIEPNAAHNTLTAMQIYGNLKEIITQNIDNLHQRAHSRNVIDFHGTLSSLSCLCCGKIYAATEVDFTQDVPHCGVCAAVGNVLKPNFIFFGEDIPRQAYDMAVKAASKAKLCIVIGTSGVVAPANKIPEIVKQYGGKVLEINLLPSAYRFTVTDLFIQGKATEVCRQILDELQKRLD
jgi:NAD-dependent deacetylase